MGHPFPISHNFVADVPFLSLWSGKDVESVWMASLRDEGLVLILCWHVEVGLHGSCLQFLGMSFLVSTESLWEAGLSAQKRWMQQL